MIGRTIGSFDKRFNLLWAPDEECLRFLCETVHPVIHPVTEEARVMVAAYNALKKVDRWQIHERRQMSGKPVYGFEKASVRTAIFDEPTGWRKVDRQLQEVRTRLATAKTEEQFQAVGLLCREVMISVGQAVFDPAHQSFTTG